MISATKILACAPDKTDAKFRLKQVCAQHSEGLESTAYGELEDRQEGGRKRRQPTRLKTYKENEQAFLEEAWVPISA